MALPCYQHVIGVLHVADNRLDDLPEVSGGELALGQEAGNLVMADRLV